MKRKLTETEFNRLLNQSLVTGISPGAADKVFESISDHALNGSVSGVVFPKWAIASTVFAGVGVVGLLLYVNIANKELVIPAINTKPLILLSEPSAAGPREVQSVAQVTNLPRQKSRIKTPQNAPVSSGFSPGNDLPEPLPSRILAVGEDLSAPSPNEEYIFPVLSEKEIRSNEKEKKRLIKMCARVTKDKRNDIARIPASSDGEIPAFYMGAGEVTNKDYRVFLFDLLIHDRKEEFLKAKPSQYLWKSVENVNTYDFLEKDYFTEKKYDYFPVVNITVQGAEMYCRWLQVEVAQLRENDPRIPDLNIRLPYEKEWMHAAKGGTPQAMYAWPLNSAQNSHNCFMGNFCVQKKRELIKKPLDYGKQQVDENNYTSAAVVLRDPKIATIDVWSYNPTSYGLFGVCGNAAEIVYGDSDARVVAKGGSWASDIEQIMLDKTEQIPSANASPTLGFRIGIFMKQ